jgi:hypothetical protein
MVLFITLTQVRKKNSNSDFKQTYLINPVNNLPTIIVTYDCIGFEITKRTPLTKPNRFIIIIPLILNINIYFLNHISFEYCISSSLLCLILIKE